jgi:hypothetical protein
MRGEGEDVPRQLLDASGVRCDKRRIIKLLGDDDVHDGQCEGGV